MAVRLKIADDFEENEPLPLASFSNGQVNPKATNMLNITMMKKKGERNPRKRVLVGETDRVTYLGTNFETESGLYTPTYCRYLVGSLNKKTRVMTLHKADIYHMSPNINGLKSPIPGGEATPSKSQFTRDDYTSTHDKMVQSFGSERAKKAWSAAKRNRIDLSVLDSTLLTALDYAEEEMKKANEEEPKCAVKQTSSFIPPYDINATTPEDVYNLADIISDDVMSQLRTPAATLVRATAQDISEWKEKETRVEFVITQIPMLPKGGGAYKTASILLYCEYLIRMYCLNSREIERKGLTKLWYIPETIQLQLLQDYTEQGPKSAGTTGILTKRMKDKLLSSLIILGLMVNGYSFDTTILQRDLKIQSTKISEVSKVLGCTVTTTGKTVKGQSKHYTVTLKVPLVFNVQTPRGSRKKGQLGGH